MAANTGLPGRRDDGDAIAASLHDPARFAVVFDRHYEEIWSYLSRRAGRALAEELASETFVRAFAGRAGYDRVVSGREAVAVRDRHEPAAQARADGGAAPAGLCPCDRA